MLWVGCCDVVEFGGMVFEVVLCRDVGYVVGGKGGCVVVSVVWGCGWGWGVGEDVFDFVGCVFVVVVWWGVLGGIC